MNRIASFIIDLALISVAAFLVVLCWVDGFASWLAGD